MQVIREHLCSLLIGRGRLAEWGTSSVMLMFSIILLAPGDTMLVSSEWGGLIQVLGSDNIAIPVLFVAVGRLTALIINGLIQPTSQIVRCIGSAVGFGFFGMLSVLFLLPYLQGNTTALSTGVGTYGVLAIIDLISTWRALADVKRYTA